jgi:hypothetical protein
VIRNPTFRTHHPLLVGARSAALRLGRADQALAVTLVEAYLRPKWRRYFEYAWWAVARELGIAGAQRVTLGASQLRASFLLAYLARQRSPVSLRMVVANGEHIGRAADAAAVYLSTAVGQPSVSAHYTGRKNPYYDMLVDIVLAELRRVRWCCRDDRDEMSAPVATVT